MSLDEKEAAVSAEKNKQEELVSDLKEDDKDEHHDEKAAAAAKAKVAKSQQVLKEAEDKLETASKAEEKLASKSVTSDIPVNKALEQTKQELSKQRSTVQLKQSAIKQQTDELATLESELGQERGEVTRLGEAHSEALHDKGELRSQIQDLERKEADFREGKLSSGKAVAQAMHTQQTLKSHEQHAEQLREKKEAALTQEITATQQQLAQAQDTLNKASKKQAALKAQVATAKARAAELEVKRKETNDATNELSKEQLQKSAYKSTLA